MLSSKAKFRLLFMLLVLSTFLVISCSNDDPVSAQEDHYEAVGMAIFDASGKIVVKILRGETKDTLKAESGKLSDAFNVKFYNDKEELMAPPDGGQKFKWDISDASLFAIWQHPDEEGGFEFHIDGKKVGNTFVEFFIEHEGHNDFRTGKIPVSIKAKL